MAGISLSLSFPMSIYLIHEGVPEKFCNTLMFYCLLVFSYIISPGVFVSNPMQIA